MVATRGRVSDDSRLALCQTFSIECPSSIFFWHVYFVILVPFSLSFLFVFFFCSDWSFVDVPLISFCPADHVPDWQPRIILGMVEARSVNVKKTTKNKVTRDFSTFLLRRLPQFLTREGFSCPFPSSTVKSNVVYPRNNRSPLVGYLRGKIPVEM